jgi:hypothetical protein
MDTIAVVVTPLPKPTCELSEETTEVSSAAWVWRKSGCSTALCGPGLGSPGLPPAHPGEFLGTAEVVFVVTSEAGSVETAGFSLWEGSVLQQEEEDGSCLSLSLTLKDKVLLVLP